MSLDQPKTDYELRLYNEMKQGLLTRKEASSLLAAMTQPPSVIPVLVEGHWFEMTPAQHKRVVALDGKQRERFLELMGKGKPVARSVTDDPDDFAPDDDEDDNPPF